MDKKLPEEGNDVTAAIFFHFLVKTVQTSIQTPFSHTLRELIQFKNAQRARKEITPLRGTRKSGESKQNRGRNEASNFPKGEKISGGSHQNLLTVGIASMLTHLDLFYSLGRKAFIIGRVKDTLGLWHSQLFTVFFESSWTLAGLLCDMTVTTVDCKDPNVNFNMFNSQMQSKGHVEDVDHVIHDE